jgi:hypothetical protein
MSAMDKNVDMMIPQAGLKTMWSVRRAGNAPGNSLNWREGEERRRKTRENGVTIVICVCVRVCIRVSAFV